MELEYYPWKLDVDVEGTKVFYESHDLSQKKKYNESLRKKLTLKQRAFFDRFGIDLSHAKIRRDDFKCGKVKYVYVISCLVKGTLKSITSYQADVYADSEVFGKEILNGLEVVDMDMMDVGENTDAANNIDGMLVSFKHPGLTFEDEQFEEWDCGYICVTALLKREYDFSEPADGPKIRREDIPVPAYGLHDTHVKKIKLRKVNRTCGNVRFVFKKGFFENDKQDPYYCNRDQRRVDGDIVFEQVDFDFSNVYLMKVKGTNYGKLKGKKYSLEKFVEKYPKVDIEIVDEMYDNFKCAFFGYLYLENKKPREILLTLSCDGGMYYMLKK